MDFYIYPAPVGLTDPIFDSIMIFCNRLSIAGFGSYVAPVHIYRCSALVDRQCNHIRDGIVEKIDAKIFDNSINWILIERHHAQTPLPRLFATCVLDIPDGYHFLIELARKIVKVKKNVC